jgi:histidine kinase
MFKLIKNIRNRLASKLILTVGLTLLVIISTWAYFNTNYQKKKLMENIVAGTDRLTNTIRLGTHYAMMSNSRTDINQIINNIGRQKEIESIRIYNKGGEIKYSNRPAEVDTTTNIKDEACYICHRTDPPQSKLGLEERIRIFTSSQGYRLLGIISPICNEPGCSTDACHLHPKGKKILGALDVVVSLADTDKEILTAEKGIIGLAAIVFLVTSAIIFLFVLRFVNQPIRRLIDGTRQIAREVYPGKVAVDQNDEMGQLATAINQMSREIGEKRAELKKQKDEFQALFEQVPCLITVQDKNFKLLRYNSEFAKSFDPEWGDFCYHTYKGRDEKCPNCPVEQTFDDGLPHYGEESGVNKDGSPTHWIVRTSPIKNSQGHIVAAMEMSLDITQRRQLEEKLEKSERKYHEIFNNIPNPVFVLDFEDLTIIDCNDSVEAVYGFSKDNIKNTPFLELFPEEERQQYAGVIKTSAEITQAKQLNYKGSPLYVNIRISPSEYPGRKVLLVTTSDITKRLETEQQLIQASKMATLGEMATGIAHELNQPLSVMKTASSFCIKKISAKQKIEDEILENLLTKIDKNVDRANQIINHMRQFARKSDLALGRIQVNDVLLKAFEIFSQQLKLKGIEVVWDLDQDLPMISGDPGRFVQVFINIIIYGRDAIEDRWGVKERAGSDKTITIKTRVHMRSVIVEVYDTGMGIPASISDKIFEPFFTTKEVGKGTGLGLSISYGIVKECGGTIRARSNPDQGACFMLTFPIPEQKDEK